MVQPADHQVKTGRTAAVFQVLRLDQWVKNGFVLAPLLFSRQYSHLGQVVSALQAFASFCAVSSMVYVLNDLCDRAEDRRHPVKQHRPIAQGTLGTATAVALIGVTAAAGLALALPLGGRFLTMLVLYAGINLAYSLGIKHVAILDVMTIAAGFVLRILAGSFAIHVKPSHWLVLCTIMISLFLGFTKRRAELAAGGGAHSRVVLRDYSLAFLDQVIAMMTGVTIICYVLYSIDWQTEAIFGTHNLLLTVPFVMYGLFRYLYLVYHRSHGEDPTTLALKDLPMLIDLVLWVLVCFAVIHYHDRLPDPFY